jgi:hypothetical protein
MRFEIFIIGELFPSWNMPKSVPLSTTKPYSKCACNHKNIRERRSFMKAPAWFAILLLLLLLLYGESEKCTSLKVPKQCLLKYLVKEGLKRGKVWAV